MNQSDFVHLHVHSGYSLLDSMVRIESLVDRVKEMGQTACAITDHGTLAGTVKFTDSCLKRGVKPILGQEFYIAPDSRLRKKYPKGELSASHLILIAQTAEGWENLKTLSTIGFTEGFYRKPRIDHEVLQRYSGGLIASTACMGGDISVHLRGGTEDGELGKVEFNESLALAKISWYVNVFGENFYIELQEHFNEAQTFLNNWYRDRYPAEMIYASADCHYLLETDCDTHDTLIASQTVSHKDDPKRWRFPTDQCWLKSTEEMVELFSETELTNTKKIADSIDFILPIRKQFFMPELPADILAEGTPEQKFRLECNLGLQRRLGLDDEEFYNFQCSGDEYSSRLEYEMEVFIKAGFVEYALILWDLNWWCKENDIFTGDGRGSGAGSLVLYSLGITGVDPIQRDCPFERFINPGRLENFAPPDVDLDFPQGRRKDVLAYLRARYGEERVSQIGTYATLSAAALVKKLAPVLGISASVALQITSTFPAGDSFQGKGPAAEAKGLSLDEIWVQSDKFRKVVTSLGVEEGQVGNSLMHYARGLRELGSHASTHASGVIITNRPVVDVVPLMVAKIGTAEEFVLAQMDMFDVELLGLVKFDILGLKTLDVLADVERMIRGQSNPEFSFDRIDLDDPIAYDLLSRGFTVGIFQAEGAGFGRLLPQIRPTTVEDLAVLTSLCRPGPSLAGLTATYIRRRQGVEAVTYDIPELENILGKNFGVLAFQEDIMNIAHRLAGFTLAEADELRKVMGKKQKDKMPYYHEKFVNGMINTIGVAPKKAETLWNQILPMAEYVFNRSHAMAYSYTTAKCLSGDTLIPLLDGTSMTIQEMARQNRPFYWLYSCDGEKIVPGKAHHARSMGVKKTVDILLDNGQKIRCTPDHRFMLRFGEWKEAKDLIEGDRLMPLYRKRLKAKGKSKKQYEEVYHPGLDLWEMTHRMVARNTQTDKYFRLSTEKRHIDHKNDNSFDNRPINLDVLTEAEHLRKTMKDNWTLRRDIMLESNRRVISSPEFGKKISERQKKRWENMPLEKREELRRKNSEGHKGKAWSEARRAALNHRVVSITEGPAEEVFDLTVDKYENFATEAGVIVHNCAYAKAHYPAYFFAAAMGAEISSGTASMIPTFAREATAFKCSLLSPEINQSEYSYSALGSTEILLGLSCIRGVGDSSARAILAEREKNGPYKSPEDFRSRLRPTDASKTVYKALLNAGAFRNIGGPEVESGDEGLHQEFNLFGFYLSGHPCANNRQAWLQENPEIKTLEYIESDENKHSVFVHTKFGRKKYWQHFDHPTRVYVTKLERKKSRKTGTFMLMLEVEDETASMKMIVGERQLSNFGNPTIKKGSLLDLVCRKDDPTRFQGYLKPVTLSVLA